ncbi:MAG: nickel-dependent hydrogenase large subunit [Chromatiales bacterium]|nr:nickel-dependent hydrogenase large subunit [Gammaproteobacteria bacterium]MBW6476799.1 nickel-dependent hydrogenase large subunit [Chromatiales bacterium]
MNGSREIDIHVPVLARVEGEGALDLKIRDGHITQLQLRIFEPPRLFEKFLEGRDYHEVTDIVARICGICPVAYQMSASHAIESIFQAQPGPWVRAMRRLFYCGEWLESHALHIHLLAAPDFLGFNSAIEMAAQYPEEVKRGLRLQGLGNRILRTLGGRSVHPVGVRIGGFYHAPAAETMAALLAECRAALPEAEALVQWVATLQLPEDDQDFVSVALRHPDEYAFNEGRLVSSDGLDIAIDQYQHYFREFHAPHSTALHAHYYPQGDALDSQAEGQPYLVGPLARVNLNFAQLPQAVQDNLNRTGVTFPSRNMFHSALARAAEIHYVLLEAIGQLENYQPSDAPYVAVTPRAGLGFGCTEAPRGILWHRYEMDEQGRVCRAIITPPTSQNQARIEEDLRLSLENLGLDQHDEVLRLHGEKVIRNYDPCISCATHFLKLKVDRE